MSLLLLLKRKGESLALTKPSEENKACLLCSLCSDRRGGELQHRTTIRSQPESRLCGDPGLREQPAGEDGGDVLCEGQLLLT